MLKLYINNQLADLGEDKDVDIKFNREFVDLNQIDSRKGDYSYSIKIPKNDVNNRIFQSANVINTIDKFVRNEEYEGMVVKEGDSTITGFIKLLKISDTFYELALISNNVAWAKLIQGKNLNELTNGDGTPWELPFVGNYADARQYSFQWYQDNFDYKSYDVTFPLIPRGIFFHSANTNPNNFFTDSLSILDIPPAVYHLKVVKKIFENIGWTVDGDLFNDPEHQKLIMPFTSAEKYGWNYSTIAYSAASGATEGVYYRYARLGSTADTYSSTFHYEPGTNSLTQSAWYEPNHTINNGVNFFQFRFVNIGDTGGTTLINGNEYFSSVNEVPFTINFNVTFTGGTYAGPYYTNHSHIAYHQSFPQAMKRAVTMLYIHDDDYFDEVIQDVTDYYEGAVSAITHPNVILAYDFLSTQYSGAGTDIYFTPYSTGPEVSQQIPGDITIVNNLGIYQTSDIHGTINPITYVTEHLRGDIEFQLRNIILLEGQYIRGITIFPTPRITEKYLTFSVVRPSTTTTAALYQVCDLFEFIPNLSANTESPNINLAANLPAISQLEFLKDWISRNELFISYIQDQDQKLIRFDTFNGFFLPNDHAIDITDKCDLKYGEPSIMPMKLPRNIYFKYSNDLSDTFLKQDPDYANLQITSDNIYTEGNSTIQSLFSATKSTTWKYYTDEPSATTIFTEVVLPSIMVEQGNAAIDSTQVYWTFSTTPRLLKDDGWLVDSSGNTLIIQVDGTPSKIRTSRFEDTRENKLNLRWDGDNGLYQTYYARYLSQIADSHIVEYMSNITTSDFNQMLPQYPIQVGNQHYFLNKIDAFSPNKTGPTKIQLIKKFTN